MSYQVLARKYRPQRFSDVIGQEHVTRTLQNAIAQQRIAHGYIFSGHRGIGKTTVARILAMALNCRAAEKPSPEPCGVCDSCTEIRSGSSVDVIEIDAATNRGIDEIRELRDAARYRPARDRFKIYILDEAHQITDAAFNALLKTLEEPPSHIVFMMATTQPEDIPQTIRSRCQHFSFHAVRFDEIVQQLRDIAAKENISAEDDALAALAEAGDGSMRDALSIMDQAIACCAVFDGDSGAKLTAAQVRGLMGTISSEVLVQAMECVHRDSSQDLLRLIDRLLNEGQSPLHFAKQLVRFLRNALVAKVAGGDSNLLQISSDERQKVASVAALFSEEDLTRFLNLMLRTHDELGYRQEQRFHLELGLLKLVNAKRLLPVEELLTQTSASPMSRAPASTPAPKSSEPRSATVSPFAARPASAPSRPAVSPFESDRARKARLGEPEMSSTHEARTESVSRAAIPISGATALAVAVAEEPAPSSPAEAMSVDDLRALLIRALEDQNQHTAADLLASGEWKIDGNQVQIRLPISEKVIDLSVSADAKRALVQEASRACGHPMKLVLSGGGTAQAAPAPRVPANGNGNGSHNGTVGARQRAAEDPVVQRMQEKFGGEIRSVIDYRQKK
ncbi:MAG TPA: DNA polymerase III subunit gamma/tau [Terriglobales bacterium]|nr:DNA polymerase III subunit gamma/tau [Terriglobales bacterium]